MRRRVPVELVPTAIASYAPTKRDGRALEDRIRACQEAEVRLMTGPGREHEAVYRLLDGLSELRLTSAPRDGQDEIGASRPLHGPARGNLPLF